MPITRTPIVDDDGTGTTGTVLDNAWKQELYGQIDAALGNVTAPFRLPPAISVSLSGVNNDWAPAGRTTAVVWLLSPTAGAFLTGIAAEADGTQHLLVNQAGVSLTLSNAHTGSSQPNRFVCPGYGDYTLGVWRSVWIVYCGLLGVWIVQAP